MSEPIIKMTPTQRRLVLDESAQIAACQARRTGKSTSVAIRTAAFAVGLHIASGTLRPPAGTLLVATNQEQASFLLRVVAGWIEVFASVVGMGRAIDSQTEERIRLANGIEIRALPGSNPRAGRGFSGHLVVDEYAHVPDPGELWRALAPCAGPSLAAPDGYTRTVISTPLGAAGPFYDMCEGRLAGQFSQHRCDIYQAAADGLPIDVEALREQVADPDVWASEYLAEFVSPVGGLVSLEDFDACVVDEEPDESEAVARLAGWDPARVKDGSALVRGFVDGEGLLWVTGGETWRNMPWEEQERRLEAVCRDADAVVIDEAGLGSRSAEHLARHFRGVRRVPMSSSTQREAVLTGMADLFRRRKVRVRRSDHALRRAVLSIRRETTANGQLRIVIPRAKSGHADEAVALALMLSVARQFGPVRRFRQPRREPQRVGWGGDYRTGMWGGASRR